MLNIMRAVISSENPDTAGAAAPEAANRRRRLYDTYIRSRLKGIAGGYRDDRVRQWLTWLATAMSSHNETQLIVDRLQPSWLETRAERLAYTALTAVIFGLLIAMVASVLWQNLAQSAQYAWLRDGVHRYAVLVFATVPLWGLISGVLDVSYWQPRLASARAVSRRQWPVRTAAVTSSVAIWIAVNLAVLGVAFNPLCDGCARGDVKSETVIWAITGLFVLGFTLAWSWRRPERIWEINVVEALTWSGRGMTIGALYGMSFGLVATLIWSLFAARLNAPTPYWEAFALLLFKNAPGFVILGQICIVCSALVARIGTARGESSRGIWPSLKYTLVAGAFGGIWGYAVGWIFWAVMQAFFPDEFSDRADLMANTLAVMMCFVAFCWYGGVDVLKHMTLRCVLAACGKAPILYRRFLEHAAEIALMSREGRGFSFFHGTLQAHFALDAGGAQPDSLASQTIAANVDHSNRG